jgi:hypothetical protein
MAAMDALAADVRSRVPVELSSLRGGLAAEDVQKGAKGKDLREVRPDPAGSSAASPSFRPDPKGGRRGLGSGEVPAAESPPVVQAAVSPVPSPRVFRPDPKKKP